MLNDDINSLSISHERSDAAAIEQFSAHPASETETGFVSSLSLEGRALKGEGLL
jgi:hypothetical protein